MGANQVKFTAQKLGATRIRVFVLTRNISDVKVARTVIADIARLVHASATAPR